MLARCYQPKHPQWHNYGGREIKITVCKRWLVFENFWADMGPTYQPGLTIERINNALGYFPENCIWETRKAQGRNRRTNRIIATPWGEMTIAEAAERVGLSQSTFGKRLARVP
jgi:hypothetical protein